VARRSAGRRRPFAGGSVPQPGALSKAGPARADDFRPWNLGRWGGPRLVPSRGAGGGRFTLPGGAAPPVRGTRGGFEAVQFRAGGQAGVVVVGCRAVLTGSEAAGDDVVCSQRMTFVLRATRPLFCKPDTDRRAAFTARMVCLLKVVVSAAPSRGQGSTVATWMPSQGMGPFVEGRGPPLRDRPATARPWPGDRANRGTHRGLENR